MSGDWRDYFECRTTIIDGKRVKYYTYKDTDVKTLPRDLPMPPTDRFCSMFSRCNQLQDLTALANWNVSSVEDMHRMFSRCNQLKDISALANWNISNVKDMNWMFYDCNQLKDISALANWNVSNVENMWGLFSTCSQLQDLTALANWNVFNVKNMSRMFNDCRQLKDITALANWDVSNVKDMECMFNDCRQLKDITALANWDVSNIENMNWMFDDCHRLQDITALANWNISNVKDMNWMFSDCNQLQDITALANWNVSNVKYMCGMFHGCELLNISHDTDDIKTRLRSLPKHSYPKQDHTSLINSLWERVKPLLKDTTKLNGYFKRYAVKAEPVKETINAPNNKVTTMWYFKYTDLSNSDGVTLQIRNSYKNAKRIVVDSLPVDPKGKVIRSMHHCFDGMENLREVIFKDSVDLKNIDDTRCMFNNCQKLERVVLPANAFPYIFDCSYMFQSCPMLKEIVAPNLFVSPHTNRLSDSLHIFNGVLNETPVDKYSVPRSINWLVELDAIKRGVN